MNLKRNLASIFMGLVAGSVMVIAQAPALGLPANLTATSVNVNGAGEQVDFRILKWSSDMDRTVLATAWRVGGSPAPPPARGARGAAPAGPAAPRTAEGALAAALKELPNVGYFWTSEVAGYLVRYAESTPLPGGGNRIILMTDRRLGSSKKNWQPAGSAPNDYEFTLIELRVPATGEGEGKASLSGKIVVDTEAKTFNLDSYDSLPVVMKGVSMSRAASR